MGRDRERMVDHSSSTGASCCTPALSCGDASVCSVYFVNNPLNTQPNLKQPWMLPPKTVKEADFKSLLCFLQTAKYSNLLSERKKQYWHGPLGV